jgi:3-oxoacyl-[acyl-carrier protein] reductase
MTTTTKKLEGKTALITGASRGIGRAIALRLADEGAFVMIHCGHGTTAAESTLRDVAAGGGRGAVITVDLEKAGSARRLREEVDGVLARLGVARLDIVVNNAGVGLIQSLAETTEAQFDSVFAINVKAPFFLLQQLVPRISDGGRIINITSFVTRMALPAVGAYSMTKAAMSTMTLWLAKELGPRGITVNAVAPGIIDTEMNAAALSDASSRKYMESISALGRVGQPEDVADVVGFLASEQGRWISGQSIDASGGSFLG